MKTTERFENAVMKLYNAFHENRLNALSCRACAVGNLCDNSDEWDDLDIFATKTVFSIDNDYYYHTKEEQKKALQVIAKSGYSPKELQKVEMLFITSCGFKIGDKEQQFLGLCAVIEYLAELDNIPNPMNYTKLFETENEKPKYELIFN